MHTPRVENSQRQVPWKTKAPDHWNAKSDLRAAELKILNVKPNPAPKGSGNPSEPRKVGRKSRKTGKVVEGQGFHTTPNYPVMPFPGSHTCSYLVPPSALPECCEPRGSQAQSPEVTLNSVSQNAHIPEQEPHPPPPPSPHTSMGP